MFRRDFLKAIGAVGAALVLPAVAKPRAAGGLFSASGAGGIGAELRALLRQSKCIGIDRTVLANGLFQWRTTHRAMDDSIGANLNREFESWLAGAKPQSVALTQECHEIDVFNMGSGMHNITATRGVNVIEVEWIGSAS